MSITTLKRKMLTAFLIFITMHLIFTYHFDIYAQNDNGITGHRENKYVKYLDKYSDAKRPNKSISVRLDDYSSLEGEVKVLNHFKGYDDCLYTAETGYVEWDVDIPVEGVYNIKIEYYPVEGRGGEIEREIHINNELPFDGAKNIILSRCWIDQSEITQDNRGNDIKPRMIESPRWMTRYAKDYMGYYEEPYLFHFNKGKNKLKLVSANEPLVIKNIEITQKENYKTYEQTLEDYNRIDVEPITDFTLKLQGEHADYKSDPMLYPITVNSSPTTEPYHPSKIKLNAIGGRKWALPGQWLTWEVDIEQAGFYNIGIKCRQKEIRGMFTSRRLLIDGEVPFKEVENIEFYHSSDWNNVVLGNEEPYKFYLDKGKHEISLEVTLGKLSSIITEVEESIYILNTAYRRIFTITGNKPDEYRDYNLDKLLPDVMKTFIQQSESLRSLSKELEEKTGQTGSNVELLNRLSIQLKRLYDKPETIPKSLEEFKTNIGGLGTLLFTMRDQPLEIDYIMVKSPDVKMPKASKGFFGKLVHEIRSFFASFFQDYSMIGSDFGEDKKPLTVWVLTGRDQAQVIKQMIDDTFTPDTGIYVNIQLVQSQMLLAATVAGKAPDVALQMNASDPVNYAIRNAVIDLSKFHDFDKVTEQFYESALVPFEFENGVYALPETQNFPMLFYRTDIMKEMGVDIPRTWDEVLNVVAELQKSNMEFGIPVVKVVSGDNININPLNGGVDFNELTSYAMFLYQKNEPLYKDKGKRVNFDSEVAINTFEQWTDLYSAYKLPQEYNFPNRFRTGEMPIGIADYGIYNYLSVFAPEIKGNWEFAPIPGTREKDGTINRSAAATSKGTAMLRDCKNQESAWEFIKWWVGEEAQVRFGKEMESLMGAAARYPTANIKAMERLPWKIRDINNLKEQWEWVEGLPEIPGGYFVPRHMKNAFRLVIDDGENPRETLEDFTEDMNDEIRYKREEFGLDVD